MTASVAPELATPTPICTGVCGKICIRTKGEPPQVRRFATKADQEHDHFVAAPTRHSPGTSNKPRDSKLRIEASTSFHADSRS